jgi:hypothetical protein
MLKQGNASKRRKGVAVAELAVCLPLLVLITIATMETCTMMFVQQSMKISAFEGARVGTVPDAKASNVIFQVETLLDNYNVYGYSISMDPPDPTTLDQGDYFTVTVDAEFIDNSLVGGWLFAGTSLSRSVSLRAE